MLFANYNQTTLEWETEGWNGQEMMCLGVISYLYINTVSTTNMNGMNN